MIDFLFVLLLVFLAGVGVGALVLGSRIRKIVAEIVSTVKSDAAYTKDYFESRIAVLHNRIDEIKKAL